MVWYLERVWPTKEIFENCNNNLAIRWESRHKYMKNAHSYMLQFNSIKEQQEFKDRMAKAKAEMLAFYNL